MGEDSDARGMSDTCFICHFEDRWKSPGRDRNPYTAPAFDAEPESTKRSILRRLRSRVVLLFAGLFVTQVLFVIQPVFYLNSRTEWSQVFANRRLDDDVAFVACLVGLTCCLVGMSGAAMRSRRTVAAGWSAIATVYGTLWSLWIFA